MQMQLKVTETLEKNDEYFITKQKDIIEIKKELHNLQEGVCPLLKKPIELSKMVIDHRHKTKAQIPTIENGLGFIRGALEFRANAFEGKVWNFYKRLGLDNEIEFSNLLRNLADFHDNPPCTDPLLHYTEVPKREKVKISEYNRIKKYYLELHPRKKVVIKKPIYVNQEWKDLVKLIDEHILNIKLLAEQVKEEKRLKKLNNKKG
jgi:hypothetical protein